DRRRPRAGPGRRHRAPDREGSPVPRPDPRHGDPRDARRGLREIGESVPNLLFVADVIGSPGRDVLRALLPDVRRRHDVHLVTGNGENAAAGFGVTREVARDLFDAGCDVLTGGNHLWDKKDSIEYIGDEPRLVRPANLPAGTPGLGWRVFKASDGTPVGVV